MKTCFKCERELPLTEFYPHPRMADGHLGKCKDCARRDVQENYARRRPEKSAADQARNRTPERRAKKYQYRLNEIRRNPEKEKARKLICKAVRTGRLRKLPCEGCGNPKVQAHHDDYGKPLEVRWLCFRCHREREHGQTVTVADPAFS